MAKSARASSRKANNQRLKAKVFGPVELERNARLSAKLLELATAPKPERPESDIMNIIDGEESAKKETTAAAAAAPADDMSMDVDGVKPATTSSKSSSKKGRIEKRKKTSKIVFPKYGDKSKKKKKN